MVFYYNFVDLCNKIEKSPSAAAEEMGFQRSVVTRWSKGTTPRQATLQKIADYFGVTVEDLTAEKKEKSPALESAEPGVSDDDLKHLAAFHAADEDTKKAIRLLLAKFQKEEGEK